MPPDDIVDLFIRYTKGRRSSMLYRKWSAIALIGGAMESRISSSFGFFQNFANLFVMLIGEPGMGKGVVKMTADIWRSTPNSEGVPAFYVGSSDYTKASLFDALNDAKQFHGPTQYHYNCLLLANDEFANTFPTYDPAFLSFLSTVWDADQPYSERRRKSGKPVVIDNPIMTCLLGYQGALLHKILIKEANDQGLLRRTILIWNDHTSTDSLLEGSPPDPEIKKQICSRLSAISSIAGTMTWEADSNGNDITKTLIDQWEQAGAPPRPIHPHLAHYVRTRPQFLIKLSMIASISESLDMCIRPRHVQRALNWLLEAEAVMPKVFESVQPPNTHAEVLEGLYAFALLNQHKLTTDLLKKWLGAKVPIPQIDHLLNHMLAIGSFIREKNDTWRVTGISPKIF